MVTEMKNKDYLFISIDNCLKWLKKASLAVFLLNNDMK